MNGQWLRQGILKRAFEGKLLSQDLNDEPASVLLERIRADRGATSLSMSDPKKPTRPKSAGSISARR
jgi:type I restriction enzyme S subunit